MKHVLLLVVAVLLLGCETPSGGSSVQPYEEVYSPPLDGRLVVNQQGVADARLVLSLIDSPRDNCYFEMVSATTDESGRFFMPPISREQAGAFVGVVDLKWQLCMQTDAGNLPLWHDGHIGLQLPSSAINLLCESSDSAENLRCREL